MAVGAGKREPHTLRAGVGGAARSLRGFGLRATVHRARVVGAVDAAGSLVVAPAAVGAFGVRANVVRVDPVLRLGWGARRFVAVVPAREPTNSRHYLRLSVWVSTCTPKHHLPCSSFVDGHERWNVEQQTS